jgi:ubiquinone biosynthesis protein
MAKLMVAVVRGDPDRFAGALILINLGAFGHVDRVQLRDDLAKLLDELGGRTVGEIELGSTIGEIQEVVRRHRLRIPRDLALLLKSFVMEEGLAAQLDPDFRLAEALRPYAYRHLLATELSVASLAARLKQFGIDAEELTVNLPHQIHRALDVVASGGFDVHLRAGELEPIADRAERLVNRIAISVLAAALIDGFAELAAADRAHIPAPRTLKVSAMLGGLVWLVATRARTRRQAYRGFRRAYHDRRSSAASTNDEREPPAD